MGLARVVFYVKSLSPYKALLPISQDRSPLACHEHFPRPEVQVAKTPAEAFQDCLQSQNKYCHAGHKKELADLFKGLSITEQGDTSIPE